MAGRGFNHPMTRPASPPAGLRQPQRPARQAPHAAAATTIAAAVTAAQAPGPGCPGPLDGLQRAGPRARMRQIGASLARRVHGHPRSSPRPAPDAPRLSLMFLPSLSAVVLAGWGAWAMAQVTAPGTAVDPASPQAPASVIAPPRPTPGDGQPQVLRDRLVLQAFEQADRNRDGQLSREESAVLPGLPERFEKVDADRNGTLSREEFRAAGGP